jgi:hypothetical protein
MRGYDDEDTMQKDSEDWRSQDIMAAAYLPPLIAGKAVVIAYMDGCGGRYLSVYTDVARELPHKKKKLCPTVRATEQCHHCFHGRWRVLPPIRKRPAYFDDPCLSISNSFCVRVRGKMLSAALRAAPTERLQASESGGPLAIPAPECSTTRLLNFKAAENE